MGRTIIKINGKYYCGIAEETYKSNAISGKGWQVYGSNEVGKLKLSSSKDEAIVVEGNRNLKSHLDRIMVRIQDDCIKLKKIEIIST